MSELWKSKVLANDGVKVQIEVSQVHPDAGDWDYFVEDRPLLTTLGVAAFDYSTDAHGYVANGPLGEAIGSFDDVWNQDRASIERFFSIRTTVLRDTYDYDNVEERLQAAGLPEDADLTADVVEQICGKLELELIASDPKWTTHLVVGKRWDS